VVSVAALVENVGLPRGNVPEFGFADAVLFPFGCAILPKKDGYGPLLSACHIGMLRPGHVETQRDGGHTEMREKCLVRLAMRSGVCFRGDVVLSMGCQSLNYVVHVVKDALEGVAVDRDPNDMRMRRKMALHQSVQLD
jgi:hypothetical protein